MKKLLLLVGTITIITAAFAQKKGFSIIPEPEQKQVSVLYNGKLLTAFCYYDSIMKPFLYPVNTLDGITVTRGYPVHPLPGESTDHPHHTGLWMNYESVNGFDFWNNSTAIPAEKRSLYGTIKHESITGSAKGQKATLTGTAQWVTPSGDVLLKEKTMYEFTVKSGLFFIDRISTLTALNKEVVFKDVKDGFFAIRVSRELEMPSTQPGTFVDVHGNKTTVPQVSTAGVTGMYYGSDGSKGDSVWSSKGRWTMLIGKKDGKNITIGMFDHPGNVGYPTYWHARGYGLFALNPLGRKVFSNGKEELNFTLQPNASVTFHYRVLIASGKNITPEIMNSLADDFAREK